jgi:arabinofuranan 3-O-arabinosyltransferase
VHLRDGVTRLTAEPTAEFDVLEVAGVPAEVSESLPSDARELRVDSWGSSERVVTIGAGDESLVHLPENFNAGWQAQLGGEDLRALRVDGWQQAWVVPAGAGGEITMTYAPQRTYSVLLPMGLVVSGAVLLGGLVVLVGLLRRRPVAPAVCRPGGRAGRGAAGGGVWAVGVVATLVLLGPVVLLGLVAGASAREGDVVRRRGRPTVLAASAALAVLLVGSAVLDVVHLPAWRESLADAVAALSVGLLIGITLASRPVVDDELVVR